MIGRRAMSGMVLVLVGLAIVAYPFISVARLQQQVLDEVPLPEGTGIVIEGMPNYAILDDEFALAYRGVTASIEDVEQTLRAEGFQQSGRIFEGDQTFTRECCGSYDGVVVRVFEGRDGITGLRYSVSDVDITVTWYFVSGFGLLIALIGIAVALGGGRGASNSTARESSGQTPVPAS